MKEFQFPQIFKAVIGEYFPIDQSESKVAPKVPSTSPVRSLKNGCLTVIGMKNSKDLEENQRKSNKKQRQFRKQNKLLTTANASNFSIRKTIQKGRNKTSNIRQQNNINNYPVEQSQANQSSEYFLSRRATRMMNRISIMKNLPNNDRKSSFLNVINEPTYISTQKFKENNIEQSNSQIRINTRENIKKASRLINKSRNQFRLQTESKIRQSRKHTSKFLELSNTNKQSSQEKDRKTNNNIKQSEFLRKSKKDQSNYATPSYSRHMKPTKKTKIGTKILQQQKKIVSIKPQKKKEYKNRLIRNKSMKIVNFPPLQPTYFSERQIFSYQSSEVSLDEENHYQQQQKKNPQNQEQRIKKVNQIHRISDELAYQLDKNSKMNNFLYKSRKIIQATRHNLFSTKKLNTQFYSNNLCNRNSFNSKYANIYTQINDFLVNRASYLSQNTISKNLNSQTVIFYERRHQDNFAAKRILATQRENLIIDYGLKFMYKMHMLNQNKF